jgi:hypothetical protein
LLFVFFVLFIFGLHFLKELIDSLLQGSIGDEFCCGEVQSCTGGFFGTSEPVFDAFSLIREAIVSDDRISHQLLGNRADPLIVKVFVLILYHIINFIFNKKLHRSQILQIFAKYANKKFH